MITENRETWIKFFWGENDEEGENFDSRIAPVWQLPVGGCEHRGDAYIHRSAKYHCFVERRSLCDRYSQRTEDYDDGITIKSVAVLERPDVVCKRCLTKWKRQYCVEV